MSFMVTFCALAVSSYLLQIFLGLKQIKDFNSVFVELRRKGKVAIGRRSGKIQSGTVVMFAVDDNAKIVDARMMQGVTVLAKFKELPQYIGQDLHYIDKYNPLVRQENKLTQIAMENAREVYLRVEMGNYQEEPKETLPISQSLSMLKNQIKYKLKGSV